MVPRKLQKYVFWETFKAFSLALLALSLFLFLAMAMRFWSKQRIAFAQVLPALPYLIPLVVEHTLPTCVLLATTLVFGRMARDNEILAMQTQGVRLSAVVLPIILLGIALSFASQALNNELIPRSRYARVGAIRDNLEWFIQKALETRKAVQTDAFELEVESFYPLYVHKGQEIRNLMTGLHFKFYDEEERLAKLIDAEMATYNVTKDKIVFELHNVRAQNFTEDASAALSSVSFDYLPYACSIRDLFPDRSDRKGRPEMTTPELWSYALEQPDRAAKTLTDIFQRQATSLSCLAFMILGIPLGIVTRDLFGKGGNLLTAFAIAAVPVYFVYYPSLMLGRALGAEGTLHPFVAAWTSTLVLFAIAMALLLGVSRK